ncbi:fatty acid desaturase [Pirellula staleyi DSM 6068]|uniref:Fatty acid desaturase n=1 Tax=Pirellula staleyi (strain ATCC 27377 / DSM 6068 / ICPB 4128) TaxID=530564 RepID=D2R6F6_PIRSD|nr:fatty acid desaturase [Pirellula staleyi]ADB15534.1 fatty acid desaturase [Pirellula staleyi DSM 6068]
MSSRAESSNVEAASSTQPVRLRGPHFKLPAGDESASGESASSDREVRGNFSLAEARGLVKDLFTPNPRIYWADFLTTILIGHACYSLTRHMPTLTGGNWALQLPLQALTFSICCALYYRAAMFIHELSHLPEKKFTAFRIVWNLLAGIPFLMPSFTYYTHLDHHRRKTYGTHEDGEYVALARWRPIWILVFLSQAIWYPPLAVIRFGLITPLTWVLPGFRQWVYRHASSLVVDPRYIRPLPSQSDQWMIRLQEGLCFAYLASVVGIAWFGFGRLPIPFLTQGLAVGFVLTLVNAIRTLAAHRWASPGGEVTFVDQMLDSVDLSSKSPLVMLTNPVGLRFHATHHLFPSLPYHNMAEAHRRLMAHLPADSPFRQTVEPSLWAAMVKLWRASAETGASSPAEASPMKQPAQQRETEMSTGTPSHV